MSESPRPTFQSLLGDDPRFQGKPYSTAIRNLDMFIAQGRNFVTTIGPRVDSYSANWSTDRREAFYEALYTIFPERRPDGPAGNLPEPVDGGGRPSLSGGAIAYVKSMPRNGLVLE